MKQIIGFIMVALVTGCGSQIKELKDEINSPSATAVNPLATPAPTVAPIAPGTTVEQTGNNNTVIVVNNNGVTETIADLDTHMPECPERGNNGYIKDFILLDAHRHILLVGTLDDTRREQYADNKYASKILLARYSHGCYARVD